MPAQAQPYPPRQHPQAAAAGERAGAHRYGAHSAEAMAPTPRCTAPPPLAGPPRPPPKRVAWSRWSAVRGHAALAQPVEGMTETVDVFRSTVRVEPPWNGRRGPASQRFEVTPPLRDPDLCQRLER